LIVRNLHYKDGYKDIILLKILQEETENQHHIKFLNQVKTYMKKNRNVENYQQLENNVNKAIETASASSIHLLYITHRVN
jgi:hypothetical protein